MTIQFRRDNPVFAGIRKGIRPKPRRSLATWMEDSMWLSAESSSESGPFRFGDATYQYGIAEAISDPNYNDIVMMTSAQVGKSTLLRGSMGYYMDYDPCPILTVVPTDKVAVAFAADFVDPLIRDTPVLKKLFNKKDGRTQTALKKAFPGGTLSIVGANTPSNLAMRPIKVILADEVDRWPRSSGKEGSPVVLATKRTLTFRTSAKRIWVSTPVLKETSVIAKMYEESDQRKFHVPCHECGHYQELKWDNVHFTKNKPENAMYACEGEHCGVLWNEIEKRQAVRNGKWVVTNPKAKTSGFHLSELYSPWSSMATMAVAWLAAKGRPDQEQSFWNTSLGLPWSGDMASLANAETLVARKEDLPQGRLVPGIGLITAGVDIQRDRIEIMVWGWGIDEEGWVLEHHVIHGDPAGPKIWSDLEQWLLRSYPHPLGGYLGIEGVAIDSGDGMHTQAVYKFAYNNQIIGRPWYAIKGVEQGPLWQVSKTKFSGMPQFKLNLIGTSDAKSNLYARFAVENPGPSYVHIPTWLVEKNEGAVLAQMTAEWSRIEYDDHGFSRVVWEKQPGARNEALDMSCYAHAMMRHLDLDIAHRLRSMAIRDAQTLDPAAIGALFA